MKSHRASRFFSLLTATFFAAGAPLFGEDWPHWLGPRCNGVSKERLPQSTAPLKQAWKAQIGIGFSGVSVRAGRVYAMGYSEGFETVSCFSEKTGELLWKDSYPASLMPNLHEGGPGATPAADGGGQLFTLSKDGQLRAYEVENGLYQWSVDLKKQAGMRKAPEWGFTASVLESRNGKEILAEAGATFAFDKKTGAEVWRSQTYRPAYGTAHFFQAQSHADNREKQPWFLATLKTDGLVILDPSNGETVAFSMWRTSFQTNSTTPLSLGIGQLFLSTGYDRGCALFHFDGKTLVKKYENMNMCNHMGNSVLVGDHLYGFDGTAHRGRPVEFTCIEAATGKKRWHFPDYRFGSVIAAAGDLIVLTETGELLMGKASPKGFHPRLRQKILSGRCWTPPVLANGKIYARNAAGTLVVMDCKSPQYQ